MKRPRPTPAQDAIDRFLVASIDQRLARGEINRRRDPKYEILKLRNIRSFQRRRWE